MAGETNPSSESGAVDSWRFMFASGFVLGVALMLLLLAVTTAGANGGVSVQNLINTNTAVSALGAAIFAIILGAVLYLLAYPSNREGLEQRFGQ